MNKYILIGIKERKDLDFEASMQETARLMQASDLEMVFRLEQATLNNQPSYLRKGKLDEVKAALINLEADGVVCNDALSPSQYRNLSEYLDTNVIDRTQLILEIFEKRAKQKESKLQVEVARLNYLLPRVRLSHHSAGREQGGGVKNRGAGEQALALRQRTMMRQLQRAETELQIIKKQRLVQRNRRKKNETLTIALVGYTNAGKSTILNWFMDHYSTPDKMVSAHDRLFESLEPSSRLISIDGYPIVLVDTVGFVSRLPHHLVKAFRSTLELVKEADLILHVLDGSSENLQLEKEVTLNTLKELECESTPRIEIKNKMDLKEQDGLCISAYYSINMDLMLDEIKKMIHMIHPVTELLIPYEDVSVLEHVKKMYTIQSIYEEDEGYRIQLSYVKELNKQLKSYERKAYDTQHNPKH
ncbi:MAG TPA: GTPase HflX [Erysipelotrichaceae bacterium]|nr:GTPase HflX [Erysipelotrichaceae bacterium]